MLRGRTHSARDQGDQGQWEQVPPSPVVCRRSERSFLITPCLNRKKSEKEVQTFEVLPNSSSQSPNLNPHRLGQISPFLNLSPQSFWRGNLSCVSLDGLDLLTEFWGQSQQWILSCQLDWVNESLLCFPNCNCNLDNGRPESCGEICSAYTIIPSYTPASSLPAAAALPFLSSSRVTAAVSLETVQLSQSEFM